MRLVIALGGNALLQRGEAPDATIQREHVRTAARALAPLARDHDLVLCHGNGPQVGVLAMESAADTLLTRPYPLDVLVAQTQGMIGYWLVQELHNAGIQKPLVALVTQTVVAADDPALAEPSKFIGPVYAREEAERLAAAHGWSIAADGGTWRRVVASPRPQRFVEDSTLALLVDAGVVVVCGGGGGAPVVVDDDGDLTGLEAVVDKDLVSALLATTLRADRLLLLTDVAAVMLGFGTPGAKAIDHLDLETAARLELPAGSMGPKVAACVAFSRATGQPAGIGALSDAAALLAGTAGTTIGGPARDLRP